MLSLTLSARRPAPTSFSHTTWTLPVPSPASNSFTHVSSIEKWEGPSNFSSPRGASPFWCHNLHYKLTRGNAPHHKNSPRQASSRTKQLMVPLSQHSSTCCCYCFLPQEGGIKRSEAKCHRVWHDSLPCSKRPCPAGIAASGQFCKSLASPDQADPGCKGKL